MATKVLQKNINEIKQKISEEINWNNENLILWRELAEEKQYFYCSTLGDRAWENYQKDEDYFLKLKIGFSLFGPQNFNEQDDLNTYFNDPKKTEVIDKIYSIVKNECDKDNLCIAFIFVIAFVDGKYAEFPIIRILKRFVKENYASYFLDASGRLYKSWDCFLKDNLFPECIYCYPYAGTYSWDESNKVILEYGRSPKSKIGKKILDGVDIASQVAGLGGAAIGVLSLAVPIAAPLLIGAAVTAVSSGVWTTGRTVTTMVDRKQHNQSISLVDPDGRACWLSLAAGILGASSAGAITYTQFIARNGRVLTRVASLVINGLEIGNVSVMGLGIINDIATMIKNKEINIRSCSELVIATLFFCHCTMSFKTAREVVIDVQERIIKNTGTELNADQEIVFQKILKETRKLGEMEGNANTIRALKKIENKESFFNNLVKVQKKADQTHSTLSFNENGLLRINDKIDVNPSDFNGLSKKSKHILMSTSRNLKNDSKHFETFLKDLRHISKNEMINFTSISSDLCKNLKVKRLNEFEINGKKILDLAKPGDIFILSKTIDIIKNRQNKNNGLEFIIKEVVNLADNCTCNNILEFYILLQKVLKTYKEFEHIYFELKQLYTVIQSNFQETESSFTVPLREKKEEDEYNGFVILNAEEN